MSVEEKIKEFVEGKKDFNVHINNVDLFKEYLNNIGVSSYITRNSEYWVYFTNVKRFHYELSTHEESGEEMIEWLVSKNKDCKKSGLLERKKSLEKEIILLDIQLKTF